ncbi:acyltransferase family protein [Tsuneonella sp. HG249]
MEADSKIPSIQLLRGLAALAVASVHLWFGFASYVDSRAGAPPWSITVSQTAVASFFVVSGAVMVISSRRLFGSPRGTIVFWQRRAIRVFPPYWIATLVFAVIALWLALPVDGGHVARSLLFIPAEGSRQVPFLPFLWPGWTLFYELVFYAIFGAFVFAGRAKAIGYTSAILVAAVASAAIWPPETYLAAAFARPIVLLFVAGLGAGLFLDAGLAVPAWLRVLAGLGGTALLVLGPGVPSETLGWDWLAGAGLPGFLFSVAIAGGPIPGRLIRPSHWLGDISYALYLLHIPFAHAWIQVFNVWLPHPGGSIGYIVTAIPLVLLLSWVFRRWIERFIAHLLNPRPA